MISSPLTPAIVFHLADVNHMLKDKKALKSVIVRIFSDNKQPAESLSYIFCSDAFLLDINKRFLDHDDFTDIITFNLAQKQAPVQGEIYISVDRVKENARHYAVRTNIELARVMFHGALHLCGFKDKSSANVKIMREKEDLYLNYFIDLLQSNK